MDRVFLSRAWEPLDQAVVDCVFPSRAWEPLDQVVRGSCVSRRAVAGDSCPDVAILKDFLDIEAEEEDDSDDDMMRFKDDEEDDGDDAEKLTG